MTTITSVDSARTRDDAPQPTRPSPFARSSAARTAAALTAWDDHAVLSASPRPATATPAAPVPAVASRPAREPRRSTTIPAAAPRPVAPTPAAQIRTQGDNRSTNIAGLAATVAVLLTIAAMAGISMSRAGADAQPVSGSGSGDAGMVVPQAPYSGLPSVMPYGERW